MGVSQTLTGHDPQQIITLLDINGRTYCDQAQAVTFGGVHWAPLDFTAVQSSDAYSPLEIKVSISRHIDARSPCRVLRVAGSETLYEAAGLDVISTDSGPGLCEIVLGYIAASTPSNRTYSVDYYHGLRRYLDPELPAQQSYGGDESSQTSDWYPGKNLKNAIDRYQRMRESGVPRSVRRAAMQPIRAANALIGRFISRFNARRSVAEPGSPYTPDDSLINQPQLDKPIPERFGRSIFAPDIAHPPYCRGGGTEVLRRNVLCLGVGEYKVHRIWIGGVLAWINGSSTGAVAGLIVQQIAPGEQMALDYVSLDSGAPIDANWTSLANQGGYTVYATDYSITWLPPSGSTETPQIPQVGNFFSSDSSGLTLPVGIVLSASGARTKILGQIPVSGTTYLPVYVANPKPNYTKIDFDQVMISARKTGSGAGIVALFFGTVDGSPKISNLSKNNAAAFSNTNYADVIFTVSGVGLTMMIAANYAGAGSQKIQVADLAIRPKYRPLTGHLEASHLRLDYTATAEYLSAPIVVEATRTLNGVPDDGIGAAAYAIAHGVFGAAVDQESFLAINGSCGGADYSGSAPWEILRTILSTANARPVWRAGKLYAVVDAQSAPSLMITPRSSKSLTITRSNRPKTIDSVSVEYTDALSGTLTSYRFVPPGGSSANTQSLQMPFCRDEATAAEIARYSYNALYRQGAVASVEIADEGMAIAPLDRMLVAAPDYGECLAFGALMPGDSWTGAAPAGSTPCVVYVRNPDGSPDGPHAAQLGPDGRIYAASATPSVALPTHGAEWAAWEREPHAWTVADITQRGPSSWVVDLVEEL